ncbi:hypothetical protein [Hydrogenimonas sp.]
MKIDVSDLDEAWIDNAQLGPQTLKIIEIQERIDKAHNEYLVFRFINQWEQRYSEPMYPVRDRLKIFSIAKAVGKHCFREEGGQVTIDTEKMIGGYIHADLVIPEKADGEMASRAFLRNIKASPRRQDVGLKYRAFKRPRK